MRHHEDGGFQCGFGLLKGANDRPGGFGVQITRRLVCQDQKRMVNQGAGNGGALLFAAGDFRRIFVLNGRDAEYVAKLICPRFCRCGNSAADDGGQQNVFPDGQPIQQQKILKHKAQLLVSHSGQCILVQPGQFGISQQNTAGIGWNVAGDTVEQSGFA